MSWFPSFPLCYTLHIYIYITTELSKARVLALQSPLWECSCHAGCWPKFCKRKKHSLAPCQHQKTCVFLISIRDGFPKGFPRLFSESCKIARGMEISIPKERLGSVRSTSIVVSTADIRRLREVHALHAHVLLQGSRVQQPCLVRIFQNIITWCAIPYLSLL